MCRLPVTFGGGMTMQNGSAPARSGRPARNAPVSSQSAETRASTAAASNDLSIMDLRSALRPAGRLTRLNAGVPRGGAAAGRSPERRDGFKPIAAAQVNASRGAEVGLAGPRATRSISARTSRSTTPGRFSSSHAFSIGRNISRAIPSAISAPRAARLAERASNAEVTAWLASGDSRGSSSTGDESPTAPIASSGCAGRFSPRSPPAVVLPERIFRRARAWPRRPAGAGRGLRGHGQRRGPRRFS